MLIILSCKNNHWLEVEEYLLRENPDNYSICPYCQSKLQVVNVTMIVKEDIKRQVENNITKWFRSEGIEGTIELIERTRKIAGEKIYNLYKEELKRRGLK